MFKRILIFICHFILSYTASYAQSVIKGKVSDKSSKETLPGVVITCANKSTITDVDGNFFIQVSEGKNKLIASLVGYSTYSKEVLLKVKDTLKLSIGLEVSNKALDEVVVSAGKYEQKLSEVTVSMEVIKTELLQSKAIAQLDQIMNQVPGVYCTDQQVSIRGGSGFTYGAGSRVAMLVDGMPMMSADAGDIKFNYIPIENMAQMEVIKGASSVLYGSSALNGVINMRTKFAGDEPETQVIAYNGIYGDADRSSLNWWKQQNRSNPTYQGVTFSHSQKFGNLDLVMGGQVYNDEGYRDSANEQRVRANLNLRYRFKKVPGLMVGVNSTIMSYTGRLFFLWKSADSAFMSKPGALSVYSNQRFNIDPYITYTSKFGGKHTIRTRYFLTNNNNSSGGQNQGSKAELYYSEYQWQKRFKNNFNLTSGAVAIGQVVHAPVYGTHFGKNFAGYIQADKKFFNRLTISGGMRVEYYKVDTAQTHGGLFLINPPKKTNLPVQPVFRAGLNYQLFEYTFIRASFGQGYRFPSDAEKYISTLVGGLNVYPNSSLQPEKGYSAEVGFKQGFKIGTFQGFFDAAYYVTHFYNTIDFIFTYDTAGKKAIYSQSLSNLEKLSGFQFQNIGTSYINGVDLSVSGTGKIGPVRVDLLSGYTFSNPINPNYNPKTDTNGTSRSNILRYRNKTMFKNDVQLTHKAISFGWSIRYSSPMQNIDRRFTQNVLYDAGVPDKYALESWFLLPGLAQYRAAHTSGVWVNDFRVGYQVSKNLKISFLINNFFNVEFMSRPGLIEPPRTFVFQAAFKF